MTDPLYTAWQQFTTTGQCAQHAVRPAILRSWQRCRAAGVVSVALPVAVDLLLTDQATALITLARPHLEDVFQYLEGSATALLLANDDLVLLEVLGDAALVSQLAQCGIRPGCTLHEELVGTLAINLAHAEAVPWQTAGSEQYLAELQPFACAAAPLFAVEGGPLGVVAAVTPYGAHHAHTLAMVTGAAQTIHIQLRNNLLLSETHDHLAALNAAIETMNEGVLILDSSNHVRRMNSHASQLLELDQRSATGWLLTDLIAVPAVLAQALAAHQEFTDQELLFSQPTGPRAMVCSTRPVRDQAGRPQGALIMLRPPESVQRLVQSVVGAQAQFTFADILGESPTMQAALRHARIAGNSRAPALISGEVGAGKQLFAHAVHSAGVRASGPFVELNCHAVSRALILGELLGYEGEGQSSRPGKFELAQGGTLVLGEVSALPLDVQTSLLRTIETRHTIRIGGRRVIPLDVRVIALTSRDLQREVNDGRFRAELYYRFNALAVHIPPLRERGDDVLLLINHLLGALCRRFGKQTLLAPDALTALLSYPWPGNIRELEAVLERLLTSTEKPVLTRADLPDAIVVASGASGPIPTQHLADRHAIAEREAIVRAGRECAGHLGRAASQLGISRATLWRKMRLYGITKEHFWPGTLSG